jgi:GxxExxY protein
MGMAKGDVDPALNKLSEHAVDAAIEVHRALGPGFQEHTYHRAMMIELRQRDIPFESESPVSLTYKGESIGEGWVDLLVDSRLVLELKATEASHERFRKQALAYLKARQATLGLVLNFEVDAIREGMLRVVNTR